MNKFSSKNEASIDNWIETLSIELGVDVQQLIANLTDFHKNSNSKVKIDWPTVDAIRKYKDATNTEIPKRSIDFLLSFMNERFQNSKSKTINDSLYRLQHPNQGYVSSLEDALYKENYRRAKFWTRHLQRVSEKYFGIYSLYRIGINGNQIREPFIILKNTRYNLHQSVNMYWLSYKNDLYKGDLVISEGFMSGFMTRKSSDSLIRVKSIYINRDKKNNDDPTNLILSGVFTNETIDDTAIFSFPFFLDKEANLTVMTEQKVIKIVEEISKNSNFSWDDSNLQITGEAFIHLNKKLVVNNHGLMNGIIRKSKFE